MCGCACDERGNVLSVPEGPDADVIMTQLFNIAYLWQMSDFTLQWNCKLTE